MKRFLAVAVLLGFVLFPVGAWAEGSNISAKSSSEKKVSKKKSSDSEQDKQKIEEERRKELENSEWAVTMIDKGGDYAKNGKKDTLVFKDGKVSFKSFEGKGYSPAGYSLVVNPDAEGGTWETFVAGKDAERLSIRGDWHQSIMNGTIVEQKNEKDSLTYYFTSQDKTALAADAAPAASEAAAAPSEPTKSLGALVSKEEKRY